MSHPCLCSGNPNTCRSDRIRRWSAVGEWDREKVECQSRVCWSECKRLVGLRGVQVAAGKQEVGKSNLCHVIPRESPKSMSPF